MPSSLFGFLIVATELKSWPIIGAFQKRVDMYFHLLSQTRGKGGFYCFIGVLTFCASDWSVARVCVLILSIVGILHLLGYPKEAPRAPGLAASDDAQQQHQSEPMDASASATISDFALKVAAPALGPALGPPPSRSRERARHAHVALSPLARPGDARQSKFGQAGPRLCGCQPWARPGWQPECELEWYGCGSTALPRHVAIDRVCGAGLTSEGAVPCWWLRGLTSCLSCGGL